MPAGRPQGGSDVTNDMHSAPLSAETVAKYEIMDGAPVRGECIPIR